VRGEAGRGAELDLGEEAGRDGEQREEGSREESDALKEKLKNSMDAFRTKLEERIDEDVEGYKTAINIFTKQLEKLGKVERDSALQKTLCSFGKSVTEPLSQGKRKKLGRINVQVTARSRRRFKLRGSRMAIMGAPTKSQSLKRQLEVDDDEETVRHKLPTLKKMKPKQTHSLQNDVAKNRRASKKH
jgi:hypothetical protein